MVRPHSKMDKGTMIKAPGKVALRRSSGTHRFPRRLRHLITNLSDMAPESGAPTKDKEVVVRFGVL